MTATEFVVMNNTDRDALHEPWRVRTKSPTKYAFGIADEARSGIAS